jgi:methylphosphotriester-DNA--protein-cysteine methyltransferase
MTEPSEQVAQAFLDESEAVSVIASKNGSKYHLPSCPGGSQIKAENRITFASPDLAEAAGYQPAANCPGLQ